MKWHLDWDSPALDALALAWDAAPDQAAVASASHQLEAALASDPLGHGVLQPEGFYAAELRPLRLLYEVDVARRTVLVTGLSLLS